MDGLALLLAFYMLPTIVAACRGHLNMGPIMVINILLGWSLIGWVIALAMACSNDVEKPGDK